MESITLQTNDSIISSGDPIGQLQFAASNESDGSASRYVIGKIYAQGEGAFNASSNPASIVFATSAANNLPASGRLKISHEGHVLPLEDNAYDLGSSSQRFRHLYVADTVYSPTGELSYLYFDTTVGDVDQVAGQLNWNSEAGSLDLGLTDDVTIHLGQSVLFRVKNSTGSTITKGEAVYASGVLGGGQVIQAAPFAANHSVDEVRFIGLMTDDLADGGDGFVNHFGHIKNVDLRTTNTALNPNAETWNIGDILFVDDTSPGGLTKVQPKDDIYVALVLADGQNGELFVRITDPGHINELHDVNTSGLVDNNLLVWNSGADSWEPSTSLTFDGTTLHTDTDGISAIFGRSNAQTVGGKVRIYVDDGDTASSVQAIKAFNAKTTGTNYGINATANGLGATKNVGLYGWAAQATTNWGLWVDAGYSIFDDRVGIKTSSPGYELHVNGSGNITGDMIVGGNLTIQGNTVTANVATMEIEDPIFTLGLASGTVVTDTNLDRGLALALNNDTMAFMGWDVSESEFALLSSGVASNSSGNYAPGTYGDLHIGGLTATTANFSSTIDAANLGAGEDNSVVILDSDGKLRTDEIDSRVWGSTLVDGAGSAGQVAFWSDADTITGESNLYWDSSNDRLGIGISSPTRRLDLNANGQLAFGGNVTTDGSQGIYWHSNSEYGIYRSAGTWTNPNYQQLTLRWITGIVLDPGTTYGKSHVGIKGGMSIGSTYYDTKYDNDGLIVQGNVGIGTASPSYKLQVQDGNMALMHSAGTSNSIRIGDTAVRMSIGREQTTNDLIIESLNGGVDESIRIDYGDGNVTINEAGANIDFRVEGDTDPNLLITDASTDRVGIGTASPSEKLDVSGNANISGHLSATTKSFLINHPTRPGHKLQYGSLESPYHGIRLTGRGTIQSGWCVIKLPEYICNLVRDDESVNIQITNYKHSKVLYVSDIDIANNEFTIKTDSWFTRNNLEFFWTFTAVRKDVEPLKVEF